MQIRQTEQSRIEDRQQDAEHKQQDRAALRQPGGRPPAAQAGAAQVQHHKPEQRIAAAQAEHLDVPRHDRQQREAEQRPRQRHARQLSVLGDAVERGHQEEEHEKRREEPGLLGRDRQKALEDVGYADLSAAELQDRRTEHRIKDRGKPQPDRGLRSGPPVVVQEARKHDVHVHAGKDEGIDHAHRFKAEREGARSGITAAVNKKVAADHHQHGDHLQQIDAVIAARLCALRPASDSVFIHRTVPLRREADRSASR